MKYFYEILYIFTNFATQYNIFVFMRLSELQTGEKGVIVKVTGRGAFRKRILEMGFIKGKTVEVILNAPLKDPVEYKILDYEVSLRKSEAALIEIVTEAEAVRHENGENKTLVNADHDLKKVAIARSKTINVGLVGNPNSGKTSLFNIASGAHERVGNYSGVTVDSKEGKFKYKDYTFKLVDLPGTYSLSAYTPEERYVRKYITNEHPDVIINVVVASNLERNFYLTTQLIDMDTTTVIALNMYDELEKSGAKFDHESLGKMIGIPMVPTISKTGKGIDKLFDKVIEVYEGNDSISRHVHINYGDDMEKGIEELRTVLKDGKNISLDLSLRYLSIKLLENDIETERFIRMLPNQEKILKTRDALSQKISGILNEDCETALTGARYGFIEGALLQTFQGGKNDTLKTTRAIDAIVTHKLWGYPVFLLFMWIMFQGTFTLGEYPMQFIQWLVDSLSGFLSDTLPDGPFKDLLTHGIIDGVGGVIVFLPNIVILYFFISFMEDSGYMARAAFIMDKLMHKMGLHGKSFIPLIMGFGCNVPAIMATRTIESRNSRLLTMLVNPLMSCSARLPVYMLFIGIFFNKYAGFAMFGLYLTGIILAIIMARLMKRFLIKGEDVPFVMELPPYRIPTLKSILRHMWEKASQYLRKMGGIILIASIIIWFLGYFPRSNDPEMQESNSYIGKIGQTIQPVMKPLGFDWKISVGLVSGMAAKEVVVSTLGILYGTADEEALPQRIEEATYADGTPVFTPLVALSLMLFVLIYFPCIATVAAIKNESGSWKWAGFVILYTTTLAWFVSFIVYQVGSLLI